MECISLKILLQIILMKKRIWLWPQLLRAGVKLSQSLKLCVWKVSSLQNKDMDWCLKSKTFFLFVRTERGWFHCLLSIHKFRCRSVCKYSRVKLLNILTRLLSQQTSTEDERFTDRSMFANTMVQGCAPSLNRFSVYDQELFCVPFWDRAERVGETGLNLKI